MDTALEALRTLREMSDVELSRRSGVSRSTLHRIESGVASPTLRTLRELALAAGVDIDVSIKPLSDPHASRAARFLCDPTFSSVPATRFDAEWVDRLSRVAGDDPIGILTQAAKASSLLSRPGTIALQGGLPALRLASAGDASGQPWAISGRVALGAIAPEDVAVSEGPDVLYVRDPHHAWRLLESPPTGKDPARAGLIIAPWRDECEVDTWEVGPVRFVAPVQILLDAIGLGGGLAESALHIAHRW